MGNRRNRRSRRVESQSPDRDENTSETSFTQGNATLVGVSENVNNILDRNLGSELTEPSQLSNEIEVISQSLEEQNNDKMSQIEEQLKNKFEEILKEIRTNQTHIVMKRMPRTISLVLLTIKIRVSGTNTHQIQHQIKIRIRMTGSIRLKCVN